ncbi:membrane protein [Thiosulfatimonas sediminis]|uniref:Membrane protein n=1 Tax=Thiosulfatimonas sediminis TaxID=2675054 RepID=A0A6F8PXL7_9GAMM|nr:flagellar motor protein MotB [Thiosulfatimonas sediminis]BBP46710.1 membrane protein [Thiosulfatimonas sediminis]
MHYHNDQGAYQSAKLKKPKEEEQNEWLVTYADAMTLILGFFILILSMSIINQNRFEEVAQGLNDGLLKKEQEIKPLKALNANLKYTLLQHSILPQDALEMGDNYLKINLPGSMLFATGSAELGSKSKKLLADIAHNIEGFELPDFNIEIEGHTDNIPINTPRFPSNWELSSSRAISVLHVFLAQGIDGNKLKAIGYADTRPTAPNLDAQGNPIANNQQQNRRVEIKIAKNI